MLQGEGTHPSLPLIHYTSNISLPINNYVTKYSRVTNKELQCGPGNPDIMVDMCWGRFRAQVCQCKDLQLFSFPIWHFSLYRAVGLDLILQFQPFSTHLNPHHDIYYSTKSTCLSNWWLHTSGWSTEMCAPPCCHNGDSVDAIVTPHI